LASPGMCVILALLAITINIVAKNFNDTELDRHY
jgi:hypothetical protein